MNRTRLFHALFVVFGAFVLALAVAHLSTGLSVYGALFVLAGIAMVLTSGLALFRPDAVETAEPATWKLALVGLGVLLLFVVGTVAQLV